MGRTRESNVEKGSSSLKTLVITNNEASTGQEEGGSEEGRKKDLIDSGKEHSISGQELDGENT